MASIAKSIRASVRTAWQACRRDCAGAQGITTLSEASLVTVHAQRLLGKGMPIIQVEEGTL